MAYYKSNVTASNTNDAKEVGLPYTVQDGVKKMILVANASMFGTADVQGGNSNRKVTSTTTITKNGIQVCSASASHTVPQGACHELSTATKIIDVKIGDVISTSNGVKSETGSGAGFSNSGAKGSSKAFIL